MLSCASFNVPSKLNLLLLLATASYRLLPDIRIKEEIKGRDAVKFSQCFPPGVIGLTPEKNEDERKAFVQDARKDTVSRECLRHAEFEGKVELCRKRDHFICKNR